MAICRTFLIAAVFQQQLELYRSFFVPAAMHVAAHRIQMGFGRQVVRGKPFPERFQRGHAQAELFVVLRCGNLPGA